MAGRGSLGTSEVTEDLLRKLLKLQVGMLLQAELKDDFERKLYQLTGKRKRSDILKTLKCGPQRVSELWGRWEELGILVKDGNGYQKVI